MFILQRWRSFISGVEFFITFQICLIVMAKEPMEVNRKTADAISKGVL